MYVADGRRKLSGDQMHVAVGWLDGAWPFPTAAEVDTELLRILKFLAKNRVSLQTRGFHECPFCPPSSEPCMQETMIEGEPKSLGSAEIHVPVDLEDPDSAIFRCPDLIVHYVEEHRYRPPQDFVDAVKRWDLRLDL